MNRGLPIGNKLLTKKWQEKDREIHLRKLRDIKPQINLSGPTKFKHLNKKAKKEQLLEDRYTEIERENRILLEKMTSIMHNGNQSAQTQNNFSAPPYQKRSLNKEARKRELLKITIENQQFLKRLQDKSSNYDVTKWETEHVDRQHMLRNICEFPYQFDKVASNRNGGGSFYNDNFPGGTSSQQNFKPASEKRPSSFPNRVAGSGSQHGLRN